MERRAAVLRAAGRIETLKAELGLLKSHLDAVPLWRPAAGLGKQCGQALEMIAEIAARLERSLVVVVIGPSGSGKSTLVNALTGGEEISPAGRERPTTGKLIVFGSGGEDAAELSRELDRDSVEIRTAGEGRLPEGVCLIDTPDTDSMAMHRHAAALEQAVAHADVLVCVFDAENPKRRDHADFLTPVVRRFDGQSLLAVLNKCDRLDEAELKGSILPDFRDYIQSAWQGAMDQALCLSARRHLKDPGWDAAAGPRHGFDQFEELRALVFGLMSRRGFVVDRRVENARRLHAFVLEEAGRELAADREALEAAGRQAAESEKEAVAAAAAAFQDSEARLMFGVGVSVYQMLSQRWVGPVGWMLALWTRLMTLGSGVAALFRFGRPARHLLGAAAGRGATGGNDLDTRSPERLDAALRGYRLALLRTWPQAAELMVRGRFDASVRRVDAAGAAADRLAGRLNSLWEQAVEEEIERAGRRLGGFVLQALVNAPAVGVLGYVGWLTVERFLKERYLTGDFFVHALWVIAIVLLLSFFFLQVVIRLAAGTERITGRAFRRLTRELKETDGLAENPVRAQIEALLRLTASMRG
jgi:GTPase SAR1 family protein